MNSLSIRINLWGVRKLNQKLLSHGEDCVADTSRPSPVFSPPEERLIEVEPGVTVLCQCHWQKDRQTPLTLVVVHGLEGSSESAYMLGMAKKGLAAGMNV